MTCELSIISLTLEPVSYTHLDVYKRQVYSGKLRASKITSRLSLIRKRDIDYLVDSLPYTTKKSVSKEASPAKQELPVPEYYSAKEIAEVHNTYETAIYEIVKKVKISRISIQGRVYSVSYTHLPLYPSAPT